MALQQKISEETRKVAMSVEIYDTAEKIGNTFSLHIDQIGELDKAIRQILLGISNSSTFIEDITKNLEIDGKLAEQIAQEVNKEVFSAIKLNMQSQTVSDDATKTLERVGGFSVERESPESANGVTSADRPQILAGLENPPSSLPGHTATPPANLPTNSTQVENHSEPLVDYLLSNPAGRAAQNIPVTAPTPAAPKKPAPPVAPQVPKNDPYKESI